MAALQLHHAGYRSPKRCVPQPVGPSDDAESGARGLTTAQVEQLVADFVSAARRAQQAGFDGVELHGAHGYILTQFLSPADNRRDDRYGGSLENRARILFEIIDGVRAACRPDFQLGLRLSAERYGLRLPEMRELAARSWPRARVDYLNLSLWERARSRRRRLSRAAPDVLVHRPSPPWGAPGRGGQDHDATRRRQMPSRPVRIFVMIGRAAILHHDFPRRAARTRPSSRFPCRSPPKPGGEGLGHRFLKYMATWDGFRRAAGAGRAVSEQQPDRFIDAPGRNASCRCDCLRPKTRVAGERRW